MMKSFEEIKKDTTLGDCIKLNESDFQYLNESEKEEVQQILNKFGDKKICELDEGILGSILGGLTGFIIGPSIGRIIANSLGIEKGIFFDILTSRLVCTALGSALTKYMGNKK